MKNFLFLIFSVFMLSRSFSQTFRTGFDTRDASSSGGNGQGLSYHANVKSDVHNVETVYLKGYINMFQATQDKKYLDQGTGQLKTKNPDRIINNSKLSNTEKTSSKWSISICLNANYLLPDFYTGQMYRDPESSLRAGTEILIGYTESRYLNLYFGSSCNYFKTNANTANSVFTPKFESSYSFFSFPVLYSLALFQNEKLQLNPVIGGNLAFLISNETVAHWDNGDKLVKNWFKNNTGSLFFTFGLKSSIKLNSQLALFLGLIGNRQMTPMFYHYSSTTGNLIEEKQWLGNFQSQIGINYKW